tara:strand:+ start:2285 stop:2524 length:240 start_codon:yes stop_codon:yes gene_type:complete
MAAFVRLGVFSTATLLGLSRRTEVATVMISMVAMIVVNDDQRLRRDPCRVIAAAHHQHGHHEDNHPSCGSHMHNSFNSD